LPREAILLLGRGLVLKLVLCIQNGWLIVDCFCLFQSYQVKCERYAEVALSFHLSCGRMCLGNDSLQTCSSSLTPSPPDPDL
jgi:hypothetical protein